MSSSSCADDNRPGMNKPATTTRKATATKVSALGSSGHWPGSFGFSPRNCEAAPSKTEFRSTLAVFILVAMGSSGLLGDSDGGGRRRRARCRRDDVRRRRLRGRCGRVLRALDGEADREVEQALLLLVRALDRRRL